MAEREKHIQDRTQELNSVAYLKNIDKIKIFKKA